MQTLEITIQPIEFTEVQPGCLIILQSLPEAQLQIVCAPDPIEDAWPDRGTIEPTLSQNADGLWVLSVRRQGEYGKFEMSYISSEILLADPALVVVLIAYHGTEPYGPKRNRHVSKGQFYRYYQPSFCGWQQVAWRQLNDDHRRLVTQTVEEKAPAWAASPGKLQSERKPPTKHVTMTTFKVVRVIEGRYWSLFDPTQEYIIGERLKQQAERNHGGGFFSYPERHAGIAYLTNCVRSIPFHSEVHTPELALLECEIWGKTIDYGHKLCSTYIRPVKVLELRSIDA